jgi:excalibur calcium-binding domain-containing protein
MKVLPRNLYFYYGRHRLYRRLYACAKVLALIAGAVGIVYLHRPEMIRRQMAIPKNMELFSNCDAARAAGRAPLRQGEPGYSPHLDKDGDGIACEPWRRPS